MADGLSQWQILLKFLVDKGGLDASILGLQKSREETERLVEETNKLDDSEKRLTQTLLNRNRTILESQQGSGRTATALNPTKPQSKVASGEERERLRQVNREEFEEIRSNENSVERVIAEGIARRAALRAKEAADIEAYNAKVIATQQELLDATIREQEMEVAAAEAKAARKLAIQKAETAELELAAAERAKLRAIAGKAELDFFTPASAINAEKAGKSVKGMGKAVEGTTGKLGGMGRIINHVSSQLTGMGGIGSVAFGGLATAGTIVIGVLLAMVKAVTEMSNAFEGAAGLKAMPDLMEKIRDKTFQAEEATKEYYRELKRISELPESPVQKAQVRAAANKEAISLMQSQNEQHHDYSTDQIEEAENRGVITHEEALRRKYQADEAYFARVLALKNKEVEDDLKNQKATRMETGKLLDEKTPQLKEAQDKHRDTEATLEREQEKLAQEKTAREAARTLKQKAIDEINEAEDTIKSQGLGLYGNDDTSYAAGLSRAASPMAYAKRAGAMGTLRGATADETADDKAIKKQIEVVQKAEDANNAATMAMKTLESQVMQLTGEFNKLNISIAVQEKVVAQRKADNVEEAKGAQKLRDQKVIDAQRDKEAAAGIAVGSAGSALKFVDLLAAKKFYGLDPTNRAGLDVPEIAFKTPNAFNPIPGLPANPANRAVTPPGVTPSPAIPVLGAPPTQNAANGLLAQAQDDREKAAALDYAIKHYTSSNHEILLGMMNKYESLMGEMNALTERYNQLNSRHQDAFNQ